MPNYTIREKKNPLAVHGHFHSFERAQNHLDTKIPEYCKNGFYMDKTLTPDCFYVHIDMYRGESPATAALSAVKELNIALEAKNKELEGKQQ